MEGRGAWAAARLQEADSGLDYLLPLYQFLHSTCMDAICLLLVRRFGDAHYVQENIGKCIKTEMKLSNFLDQINQTFKDVKKGEKCSKKKKKRCKKPSSSPFQALCSEQQQQCSLSYHQEKQESHSPRYWSVGQQLQSAQLNKYASQQQSTGQDQHSAQSVENLQGRRPADVKNIAENRVILEKLSVGDLLEGSKDVCRELHGLDLNFILNIVLNKHVNFVKDKEYELLKAIFKIKDIRKALVHANYDFNECNFKDNLTELKDAVAVVHKELLLPEVVLQHHVDQCWDEAKSGSKAPLILSHLVSEAHSKYSLPNPTFVPPNITSSQMYGKEVMEDLDKFIVNQQGHQDPILLCGEQRQEKSRLLEKLASTVISTMGPLSRFKLVLHLNESHTRNYHHSGPWARNTRYASLGFQDQIFACLTNLVPVAVHQHSMDSVKAVIKRYQKYILFLINWNINTLDSVRREIQWGTWIITYEGKDLPLVDWQVLRMEPYTEVQVEKILCSYPNKNDLLNCYYSFDKKNILSSLDMIQIFCEVSGTVSTGTDFEVVEKYVLRTLECMCTGNEMHIREQDMLRLGEVAFISLCKGRSLCKDVDICNVQSCVYDSFLYNIKGKGWSFKHLVVRDFLAAKYVVLKPSIACEKWVKENIAAFKRVFKFVCFMWFEKHSVNEYLLYMETFLRKLLHVPDKKKRAEYSEKEARNGDKKSNRMKEKEREDMNKHKDPFDDWGFLLELDEACDGKRKVLKCIASILSDIPCWRFNASDCLDTGKLTRLEKVVKKVTLDERDPLIIKLKSNTSVTVITELWKKLKCIEALYGCANLMVTIEGDDGSYLRDRSKIENFLKMVANTQIPLYITRYKGPGFSSSIPNIIKCVCMHRLEILEVSVFDVASLREVMACGALSALKEVFIKINLELLEQTSFTPASIELPSEMLVNIIIEYFPKIQQLFDCFKSCHRLYSLSIHDLYISTDFKLDLSAFNQLESLNIRFESPEEDIMQVEGKMELYRDRLPRYNWLFHLYVHLSLPQKLKRLLLRNVDFFSDSNQDLIDKFFKKYSINRLLMLDTQLSLAGVGKILCSQTEDEDDQSYGGGKRLRKLESLDMKKLAAKRMRLSKEEREVRKWNRPNGKEVVITSGGQLCSHCSCFPCMCLSKLDRDEGCNSYKSMAELINDMYCCNVQSFSYSFNQCTIRKDIGGDLRVECIMRCLSDTVILEMDSRSCISDFFLPLMLAQSVTLEGTELSPVGVAKVAEHLMHIKSTSKVEPFSLTIETSWHPSGSSSPFQGIKGFLKTADYLSVVHFRCVCTPKCFYLRKTYKGEIMDMVQVL